MATRADRAGHTLAVERTLDHLRANTATVRRRYPGVVVEETAKDILAAEYRHTTAFTLATYGCSKSCI